MDTWERAWQSFALVRFVLLFFFLFSLVFSRSSFFPPRSDFAFQGTYAVPAGLTPVGDGIFFQWIQCSAILVIGLIANLAFGGAGVPFELVVLLFRFFFGFLTRGKKKKRVDHVLQHGVNVTVNCSLHPYQFEPIAMAGGALWTLGNCTVIPIIGMVRFCFCFCFCFLFLFSDWSWSWHVALGSCQHGGRVADWNVWSSECD